MKKQWIERKEAFSHTFACVPWRSPKCAQGIFLLVGFVVTLSIFSVLLSFVQNIARQEQNRTSQDFAEDFVEVLDDFLHPVEMLSSFMMASGSGVPENYFMAQGRGKSLYDSYAQIIWFHEIEGTGWIFKDLVNRGGEGTLQPDQKMLSVLLKQGALQAPKGRIVDHRVLQVKNAKSGNISPPLVFVRSVSTQHAGKGFLLVVAYPKEILSGTWLRAYPDLSFVRIRDLESHQTVFTWSRGEDEGGVRQVYEFPFLGHSWEVSSAFVQGGRMEVLVFFPYTVMIFGLFALLAGVVYMRGRTRQEEILAHVNQDLAQKNAALEKEVEARKKLYQVLKDSQAENRLVIDAVGDVIFEVNEEGAFIFLNRAWAKITGFDIDQSLGQEFLKMLHPQDQEIQRREFKNLLKGLEKDMRLYTQIRTANGTFRAVELFMSVIQQGEKIRYIGTLVDIEARRRAEQALVAAEKKYRSIVERAAGGIYQMTPDGLLLNANPAMARILGYESPEAMLRDVKNANEDLYAERIKRAAFCRDLERKDGVDSHETQMRKRSGDLIWVNENARIVRDEHGQTLFIEGSIEDITQRKETDMAIREAQMHSDMANRAKSEFLANMSHELRTPLNAIIGFSEMIRNEVLGPIEQKAYQDYAGDIYESGQQLLRVINEILDISRIEAGDRVLSESVVNVGRIVDSAMDMLSSKIQERGTRITVEMEGPIEIVAEERAIKQIVLNLLSNAVKFTPEGGRVIIAAHRGREGRFYFSITDTGVGLDEYEIKKALSPFGQVNNDFSRSGSGTGLGLTLVDALIKIHGGEFELLSQKGIGTTATMILPAERVVEKKTPVSV